MRTDFYGLVTTKIQFFEENAYGFLLFLMSVGKIEGAHPYQATFIGQQ